MHRENPDQVTWGPGAPVRQHTVLGTGQAALPRALRHLLWITQIVIHRIRGTVHGVQHTPAGPSKMSTVEFSNSTVNRRKGIFDTHLTLLVWTPSPQFSFRSTLLTFHTLQGSATQIYWLQSLTHGTTSYTCNTYQSHTTQHLSLKEMRRSVEGQAKYHCIGAVLCPILHKCATFNMNHLMFCC